MHFASNLLKSVESTVAVIIIIVITEPLRTCRDTSHFQLNCMHNLQEEVRAAQADGQAQGMEALEEVEPEPIDMAFPTGFKKQITYLLLFPIIFPLWLTLPDTRAKKGE